MSIEKVREYFKTKRIDRRIQEFENSNATVPLAAKALHCKESRIAKMLSFDEAEPIDCDCPQACRLCVLCVLLLFTR